MLSLGFLSDTLKLKTPIDKKLLSLIFIFIFLFILVFVRLQKRQVAYEVLALDHKASTLVSQEKKLQADLAFKMRPRRLSELAIEKSSMRPTDDNQVIYLNDTK